jgi:hypothetical protein
MGQVRRGCATTTEAVRRAIQHSQESLRALAKRYGINQKSVAKWKKRGSVVDLPTGPKDAGSTAPTVEEEAVIVAFRRHTLLPLDDCLYALHSHEQLRSYLCDFVDAYNFARRLKPLKGLTPYEFICTIWTSQPDRFIVSPLQKRRD